ncbi:cytochrome c oxidase accessory protein CcoG [Sphingosinicella sp. LY1275]|uniref:cytochrome c oxidase accessory protein CcoG n=1 Tax=Sphingosinicella sp. LY1275 TaxID=3095379 RepID=UPI002ADEFAC2|nr:cytochrome c oxidase accessory protein CcoG [Sphingosinicella sp. LY1275]MEA1015308.1 cytochrome c oxidase accessory protein CcoG [Sphingosinicella sp. LY1275]
MSSLDELIAPKRTLYAKREPVYPKAVDGTFRRLKWLIMAVTLTIYYVTPWLRWDRGPYAPDQAVLIDLANRRFYMFSIEIWPHEFYYVAGLLIMAGIGLFLLTSAVGRAWCGYACPQTVWTDLFQHVERFVDGDRNAQIRLAKAPWGAKKIARRVLKHSIWLAVGLLTGGAWIFYFADAPTLFDRLVDLDAPIAAYGAIGVLTATTYIFGGLLREQVCIYMCPWPRIQGAMLDEKSLIVTYKEWRGEPRARGTKKATIADLNLGDCIDCNACVAVCPTGIDIREGQQIGCITCSLCIDACDKVMTQIGRPRGLIDYTTLENAKIEAAGDVAPPLRKSLFRPRTLLYFCVWASIGVAMLFALGTRQRIDLNASQDRNPVYVQLSDGGIRNNFSISVRNMQARPRSFAIELDGLDEAVMWNAEGSRDAARRSVTIQAAPDAVAKTRLFVAASAAGPQREPFRFTVRALDAEGGSDSEEASFERPETRP